MAIYTGPYRGAKSCTSGPQPGAWGAMDYFLSAYSDKGGLNTGIYNCRTVRGGRTTSLHGEGRAADFGIRPYSAAWGWALAKALVAFSDELGIQCVIWDGRIWSSAYPHSGFRKYSGVNPHRDHIHVEFTWARANAGRKETARHFAKVLGGVKPDDIKIGGGGGSSNTYKTVKPGDLIKLYSKGKPVEDWQGDALGYTGKKKDGYFGPDSVADTKKLQIQLGLRGKDVDGIVGPDTIKAWEKAGKPKLKAAKPSKPSIPKFDLPKGHWYGVESKNPKNHSGYWKADRPGITLWQKKMKSRGWNGIKVTGRFTERDRKILMQFQKEKGLKVDGGLGRESWDATWTEKVT